LQPDGKQQGGHAQLADDFYEGDFFQPHRAHGKTCPEEADERGQAQQGSRDATHHREQQRGQV
jgi:hypothetical protein